jgi:hypothetical protein
MRVHAGEAIHRVVDHEPAELLLPDQTFLDEAEGVGNDGVEVRSGVSGWERSEPSITLSSQPSGFDGANAWATMRSSDSHPKKKLEANRSTKSYGVVTASAAHSSASLSTLPRSRVGASRSKASPSGADAMSSGA